MTHPAPRAGHVVALRTAEGGHVPEQGASVQSPGAVARRRRRATVDQPADGRRGLPDSAQLTPTDRGPQQLVARVTAEHRLRAGRQVTPQTERAVLGRLRLRTHGDWGRQGESVRLPRRRREPCSGDSGSGHTATGGGRGSQSGYPADGESRARATPAPDTRRLGEAGGGSQVTPQTERAVLGRLRLRTHGDWGRQGESVRLPGRRREPCSGDSGSTVAS